MVRFSKILFVVSLVAIIGYFISLFISLYLFAGGWGGSKSASFEFDCTRGELAFSFEKFLQNNPTYKYGSGFDSARCYPLDYCTDIYLKGEKEYAVYVGLVNANLDDSVNTSPSYICIRNVLDIEKKEWKKDYEMSDDEMEYLDSKLEKEILLNLKNDSCNCKLLGKEYR
jgi:hypothetical protein